MSKNADWQWRVEFHDNQDYIKSQDSDIQELERYLSDEEEKYYDKDGNEFRTMTVFLNGNDFKKVHLGEMMAILGIFGTPETKIFSYILSITNYNPLPVTTANTFSASIEEIRRATHTDKTRAGKFIKDLVKMNVLTKIGTKTYRVNPNIISMGKALQQQEVMKQFNQEKIDNLVSYLENKDISDDEKEAATEEK